MITDKQKANVLIAMMNPIVQKNIVTAMFDCMTRADTGVSDVWAYVADEDYPSNIRAALFGAQIPVDVQDDEEEEAYEDPDAVCYSIEAMQLLIDNVKQMVLDSFNGSE